MSTGDDSMKFLFLVATFLLPIYASATCNISAGRLELPETRIINNSVVIGCINDSLEFVSPEIGSTYSWVSMGKIDVPTSSADKLSIHIDSKIVLAKNWRVSISSNGRHIDKDWIPYIAGKYAKIENGIVTATIVADRNFKFPPNENWILMPRTLTLQVGSEQIGPGYHYKRGQFSPPNESPDGTRK